MKTNCAYSPALAASLIFLSACGSDHSSDSAQKVCYQSNCIPTIEAAKIVDPKSQYRYPDKKIYPKVEQREQYRAPHAFLDLRQVDGTLSLSKNLRLRDFALPIKGRYGVVMPSLVNALQSVYDLLGSGLFITSGYRSPGYNTNTPGSATWSRHTYGDGVDLQHSRHSLQQIKAACEIQKASFVLVYPKHVHCDWRQTPLDQAFYPPAKTHGGFTSTAQSLSEKSRIVYQKTNEGIQIATFLSLEDLAEEGVPTHRWMIRSPSDKVYEFIDSQILFTPEESGIYEIEVNVGEFFTIRSHLTW